MLTQLKIRSFGIIEEITWKPGTGFNIITGETASGKSLIIDALEALLFGQVNEALVRHGDTAANIEGYFQLSGSSLKVISHKLSEKQIDLEDGQLIVTLEIKPGGRNIFRINGIPVPKNTIENMGSALADIHGQTQHLSLYDKNRHLELLDIWTSVEKERREFYHMLQHLNLLQKKLETSNTQIDEIIRRQDYLNYQINEIYEAGLVLNEDTHLAQERHKLESAEVIKQLCWSGYNFIAGGPESGGLPALDAIAEAATNMQQLKKLTLDLSSESDNLEDIKERIQDIARNLHRYADEIEADPRRLTQIQERTELINHLKKKYGGSIEAVLTYSKQAKSELDRLNDVTVNQQQLNKDLENLASDMAAKARDLSLAREKGAAELEAEVNSQLKQLGMNQVAFKIELKRRITAEHQEPEKAESAFNRYGIDEVEFLASTNPGEPFSPIRKIASTGEVSRFTLALKNALSQADKTPTLVFDEIDIGVGGRSGEIIGQKLWLLSRYHQVICITHLPQLAAYADEHYKVVKETHDGRNTSNLLELSSGQAVEEIAVMLSSSKFSSKALDNAYDLVERTRNWKMQNK